MLQMTPPCIDYPADGSVAPVSRFVWRPVEIAPPTGQARTGAAGKRIVIVGGTDLTAGRIAGTLGDLGATPYRYVPDGRDPEAAAATFKGQVGRVDGIIDLNLEAAFSLADPAAWEMPLRHSIALLKAAYREWAEEIETDRVFYMPVTLMGGTMGFTTDEIFQPLGGIWAGLAKSLPRELPNCNVRILDLDPVAHAAIERIVTQELYDWGFFEIGYRAGKRYTLAASSVKVGKPGIVVGPADNIVMSGGARGIGFALARALARDFGCRVVITGRSRPPSGEEPWLSMDAPAFKRHQHDLFKAPQGKPLAGIRQAIEHMKRMRDLYAHMQQVSAEGLRVEYHVCDFNDPAQVAALLDRIGPSISGIIHNAGVDTPVRLPAKSVDSFVKTVRVKVNGFLNIVAALQGRPLKFLCNVGSLTGRWGGMVGQMDYGAANEGLSRLGLWAATTTPFPVKTLCWPTWEKLGMIANFEATLKYMSAVNVDEGVYHWERELLASGSGEIAFVGRVGNALSPTQLRGYPPLAELPGIERLHSHAHYLGEALAFQIFRSVRSRNQIDRRTAPCMSELTVDGTPALPISVLLDYALSLGDWVVPEGWLALHLHEIRDVEIDLDGLKAEGQVYNLEKEGQGRWSGDGWIVDVRLARSGSNGAKALGRLQLVYRTEPPLAGPLARPANPETTPVVLASVKGCKWAGFAIRPARWSRCADGTLVGQVPHCRPADLWSLPYTPASTLPTGYLENIIRASMSLAQPAGSRRLAISTIRLFSGCTAFSAIAGSQPANRWDVVDNEGRVGLRLEGIGFL